MSLVDYASSSDDENAEVRDEQVKDEPEVDESTPNSAPFPLPLPLPLPRNQRSGFPSNDQLESASNSSVPSVEKLPDASFLLNSPSFPSHMASGNDHSSRVAAAMAESASRKREANGSASSFPRRKVSRGTLPHTKRFPDTVGGLLVPPQVSGRSNVVTEDMGKLFVRRHSDPPSSH